MDICTFDPAGEGQYRAPHQGPGQGVHLPRCGLPGQPGRRGQPDDLLPLPHAQVRELLHDLRGGGDARPQLHDGRRLRALPGPQHRAGDLPAGRRHQHGDPLIILYFDIETFGKPQILLSFSEKDFHSQNIAFESIDVQLGNSSIISRQAVGARLSVQERAGLPLVDEYGVDLAPGARTSLALQVVNITRCSSIEMES